ncbi:MAG: flippase-like domain-containing protein [Chloroflexi bacterium]|nr:flippase-like domain-containing protein [Chloroflexota bacterium]
MRLKAMPVEETQGRPAQNGRWLLWALRIAVSGGLLYLLLSRVGFTSFWEEARQADLRWLVVGVLLVVLALVVSAYKWGLLLAAQGTPVSTPRLFVYYLVGLFFNNFLPSNIGGDVVRIHDVARHTGKGPEAAASVIGERLLASLGLGLMAVLGLALGYQVSGGFSGIVLGVLLISAALVAPFASARLRRAISLRLKLPGWLSPGRRLEQVANSLATSFSQPRTVVWVVFWSLVFQLVLVCLNWAIFMSLGVNIPPAYYFLFTPIIMAIQIMPISINGLGVREGAYVYFFGWAGVSAAQAIAGSLFFWALVGLVSLVGGVIFAFRK